MVEIVIMSDASCHVRELEQTYEVVLIYAINKSIWTVALAAVLIINTAL